MESIMVEIIHKAEWDRLYVDLMKVSDVIELQVIAESKFVELPQNFVIVDDANGKVLTKQDIQDVQSGKRFIKKLRVKNREESTVSQQPIQFEDDEELQYIGRKLEELERQQSEKQFVILNDSRPSEKSFEQLGSENERSFGTLPNVENLRPAQQYSLSDFSGREIVLGSDLTNHESFMSSRVNSHDVIEEGLDCSEILEKKTENKRFPSSLHECCEKKKERKLVVEQPLAQMKETLVVNEDIQCDGCFAFPIEGTIYKCIVCATFDLCAKCEASQRHCHHPMLQIKKVGQYPVDLQVTFDSRAKQHMEQAQLRLKKKREEAEKTSKDSMQKEVVIDPKTLKQTKVSSKNFLSQIGWL